MTARRPGGRGNAGMKRTALPFGLLFPAVSDMGPKPAFPHARTGRLSTIEAERREARGCPTAVNALRRGREGDPQRRARTGESKI